MTVDGSMSSGDCSLEEELEDCFFTAKTTFFRDVQAKRPAKVNALVDSRPPATGAPSVVLKEEREAACPRSGCGRLGYS